MGHGRVDGRLDRAGFLNPTSTAGKIQCVPNEGGYQQNAYRNTEVRFLRK
ncbi:unnamed protein product [Ectocarpus sp. CCAP 1310/34]|nr:unnamed protein product [Ectocarpus sp. CCAP 1310/34]